MVTSAEQDPTRLGLAHTAGYRVAVRDPPTPTALDVETLDLNCGYDSNTSTERCEPLGLTDIVSAVMRGKNEHQTLHLGPVLARRTASSAANRQVHRATPRPGHPRRRPRPDAKFAKWAKRCTDWQHPSERALMGWAT